MGENFEYLRIENIFNWKYQAFTTMFHKMAASWSFSKLHEIPLLLTNIVKGALSGLRVFLFKNHTENEVGSSILAF